jgi:hypothetical protein
VAACIPPAGFESWTGRSWDWSGVVWYASRMGNLPALGHGRQLHDRGLAKALRILHVSGGIWLERNHNLRGPGAAGKPRLSLEKGLRSIGAGGRYGRDRTSLWPVVPWLRDRYRDSQRSDSLTFCPENRLATEVWKLPVSAHPELLERDVVSAVLCQALAIAELCRRP